MYYDMTYDLRVEVSFAICLLCLLTFVVILALAVIYERLVWPIPLNIPLILDYASLTVRCSVHHI